jgi:hypothetical protein
VISSFLQSMRVRKSLPWNLSLKLIAVQGE